MSDKEFAGFPMFNHVRNPNLRAWNRINVVYNLKEIVHNNVLSVKYVAQFTRNDQLAIHSMLAYIEREGYEQARRDLFRSLNNG